MTSKAKKFIDHIGWDPWSTPHLTLQQLGKTFSIISKLELRTNLSSTRSKLHITSGTIEVIWVEILSLPAKWCAVYCAVASTIYNIQYTCCWIEEIFKNDLTSCIHWHLLLASSDWRNPDKQLVHQPLEAVIHEETSKSAWDIDGVIGTTFEKPLSATGWSQWLQVRQSGCQEALSAWKTNIHPLLIYLIAGKNLWNEKFKPSEPVQ